MTKHSLYISYCTRNVQYLFSTLTSQWVLKPLYCNSACIFFLFDTVLYSEQLLRENCNIFFFCPYVILFTVAMASHTASYSSEIRDESCSAPPLTLKPNPPSATTASCPGFPCRSGTGIRRNAKRVRRSVTICRARVFSEVEKGFVEAPVLNVVI